MFDISGYLWYLWTYDVSQKARDHLINISLDREGGARLP